MSSSSAALRAHNVRATAQPGRPFGVITRGTTGANRLRRADRWMRWDEDISALLRAQRPALAVDIGYGASDITTVQWAGWLRQLNPGLEVVGLEISPDRIQPPRDGVRFELGGFELAGYRPHLARAFNVLRQYDVDQVEQAWQTVCSQLAPGGFFIEGTCDELGRRCSWIKLNAAGPQTLTLAWDPHDITAPSQLAQRLPKILIHRNHPGHAIYELLLAADQAWEHAASWAPYGPRIRWRQAHELLRGQFPGIHRLRPGLRDNLLTVDYAAVAPH